LLCLVLLALIPAIALHVVSAVEKRRMARTAAEDNLYALADLAAGNASAVIDGARDILRGLSRLPEIRTPNPERVATLLANGAAIFTQFSEMALLRPDGRLVASSRPGRPGADLSDRPWFRRALTASTPTVDSLGLGPDARPESLILAESVRDASGAVTGVCVLALPLDWFSRIFTGIRFPEQAQACLVDGNDRILANWPPHPERLGQPAEDAGSFPPARTTTGPTAWTAALAGGVTSYNVAVPVPVDAEAGLRLRLRLPLRAVLAPLDAAMYRDMALLVLTLALALMATHWFAWFFVLRPTARLARLAQDMAVGHHDRRSDLVQGGDEMADLARALYAMADAFQERIRFTQEIIDVVPAPLYYKDKHGHYLGCNRAYENAIRPLSAMYGKLAVEFAQANQASLCTSMDRQVLESPDRTLVYECPTTFRDGSIHDVVISKSVFRSASGEPAGIVAVMLDITDRKRSERDLAASESRYRALLASMGDGFVAVDSQGRMVESNPAFRDMLGYSQEELAALTVRDITPVTWEEDEEPLLERFLEDPQFSDIFYREYRRKDGTVFPAALRVSRYPVQAGNACRFFAIARDMTVLAEYEKNLRAAKEAAERANRAKSDFLAKMSHEIRTPLNAVTGMIELTLATGLSPEQRDALDTAREASAVLLDVINDILDISRIEAKRLELVVEDFDLRRTVATQVRTLRPQAEQRGLTLSLRLDPRLPRFVRGDRGRLGQILMNLVGNALKFTEHGGVSLTAELASTPEPDGAAAVVEFRVADTGVGIAPDKLDRIFDMFTQADATIGGRYGGTGLGLAICRELARLMHGGVAVASTQGQGSVFTVTLAFDPGREPAKPARPEPAAAPGPDPSRRTLRILVAEDNPVNVKVAMTYLARRGHQAMVADHGREALEMLEKRSFDLVLMDLEMPEVNGLEVTERLRAGQAGECNRNIPVIAMTAHALGDTSRRCLDAGMTGYLSKPLDFKALDAILDEAARQGDSAAPAPGGSAKAEVGPKLDPAAALARLGGDAALLREIQADFLRLYPGKLRTIVLCRESENWEEAAMAAHSLKNIAGAVGAEGARVLAGRLEESLRQADADLSREVLATLRENLVAVRETLLATPSGQERLQGP
jgi:PAS domain S-box-containing protein